jgi:hypothetical protein
MASPQRLRSLSQGPSWTWLLLKTPDESLVADAGPTPPGGDSRFRWKTATPAKGRGAMGLDAFGFAEAGSQG